MMGVIEESWFKITQSRERESEREKTGFSSFGLRNAEVAWRPVSRVVLSLASRDPWIVSLLRCTHEKVLPFWISSRDPCLHWPQSSVDTPFQSEALCEEAIPTSTLFHWLVLDGNMCFHIRMILLGKQTYYLDRMEEARSPEVELVHQQEEARDREWESLLPEIGLEREFLERWVFLTWLIFEIASVSDEVWMSCEWIGWVPF